MLASRGQLRASFLRWALFTVPLCVLLGFLSGQLGSPDTAWFQSLVKPGIYPEPKWQDPILIWFLTASCAQAVPNERPLAAN